MSIMQTRRAAGLAAGFATLALGLVSCAREGGEEQAALSEAPRSPLVGLAVDSAERALIRAHARELFISHDEGRRWASVPLGNRPRAGQIATVAISRPSPGTVYIAGPGLGILRSTDRGRSWHSAGNGLPSTEVTAFATHATRPATLYAVVKERGLFRTEDGGATWVRMEGGPGPDVRHLLHSDMAGSMESGWLFAALPSKVRRSMDCFCGWRDTGALPDTASPGAGTLHGLAYDPQRPEHVFVASAPGVYRTTDGGRSWALASRTEPAKVALAFDASTRTLLGGSADGTVFRSADGGRTWVTVGKDRVDRSDSVGAAAQGP